MGRIDDDIYVAGHFKSDTMTVPASAVTNASIAADADIDRDKLEQTVLAEYPVNLVHFRVWDAMQTNLPGTSASDDLGLIGGTFATASPMIQTYDVKAAGAQTLRARIVLELPIEYDAGETVQIRVRGGMITTVADNSCTVDIEACKLDEDGAVGADICTTAAQSINSLTKADKDFTITPTSLNPGDQLDVRVSVAVNDAATATTVKAALSKISLLCDARG
jgi:hypothetical protein